MSLETMSHKLKKILFEPDSIVIHDPNLIQGRKFLSFEKKYTYTALPHLKLLEETSDPKFDSIIEALGEDNSTHNQYNIALNKLSTHEQAFNEILAEYSRYLQSYRQTMTNQINRDATLQKYFNKIIIFGGNYYYVNNFGYKHKFSTTLWESYSVDNNKGQNCANITQYPGVIDNDDFNKLKDGPPMNGSGNISTNVAQACDIAGKIIKRKGSSQYAWVDAQGIKHGFSDNMWKIKSASCGAVPEEIDGTSFDNIPVGGEMSSTSICNAYEGNPRMWDRIDVLNSKLMDLTQILHDDIAELAKYDSVYKDKLNQKTSTLSTYKQEFTKDKKELQSMNFDNDVLKGELEDTNSVLRMNKIRYIVWIILLVALIGILLFSYKNNASNLAMIVILIVIIILVYYGGDYVLRKLNL
jgi:hypothetical protein